MGKEGMGLREKKRKLRERMRKKRESPRSRKEVPLSRRILERTLLLPALWKADWISSFAGVQGEPATLELLGLLLACGKKVAVPVTDFKGKKIALVQLKNVSALKLTERGLLEPKGKTAKKISPIKIGVHLIPGMAFDRKGRRLGRGLGFYDRLLLGTGGARVGLCFSWQLVGSVPAGKKDARMDWIVSEKEIVHCPGRRR